MSATIIDGKAFAARLRRQIADHVTDLKKHHGLTPGLAVVQVGHDPASDVYVRNKGLQARESGMKSLEHKLPETTSQEDLIALIESLNADAEINGILVQLPLPGHIDSNSVLETISPDKDVDGFHVINAGRLATGQPALTPCTPLGCMMLLRDHLGDLRGKTATVIGRSNIVGKPMAQMLLQADCSVTIAHRWSTNTADLACASDIVIVAVGQPGLVTADWVKPGATVIDVGINRISITENGKTKTRLVGDVDFDAVKEVAGAITPVPGGVGPMTIACLLANTLTACCRTAGLTPPQGLTA